MKNVSILKQWKIGRQVFESTFVAKGWSLEKQGWAQGVKGACVDPAEGCRVALCRQFHQSSWRPRTVSVASRGFRRIGLSRSFSFSFVSTSFILVFFRPAIQRCRTWNNVEVARFKSRSDSRRDRQCRSSKVKQYRCVVSVEDRDLEFFRLSWNSVGAFLLRRIRTIGNLNRCVREQGYFHQTC